MWRTPRGSRILTDLEWQLFSTALRSAVVDVEAQIDAEDRDHEEATTYFGRMRPEHKLSELAQIASALRYAESRPPSHTAANEGAVSAVYYQFLTRIETEIEDGTGNAHRKLLQKVAMSIRGEGKGLPVQNSENIEDWALLIDECVDEVLFDNDFSLPCEHLSDDESSYFRSDATDPSEAELAEVREILEELLSSP